MKKEYENEAKRQMHAYVHVMMPSGMRKAAACTLMPVMVAMVAAPPSNSMAVTSTLVRRQNARKTLCARGPHLIVFTYDVRVRACG